MNRTQALCLALGWQGGTIHQVAEATGCSVNDLLYKDIENRSWSNKDYCGGWFAGRTCTVEFNRKVNFPKCKGNIDFWVGVAEGIMLDSVIKNQQA